MITSFTIINTSQTMEPVLTVRNLFFGFDNKPILNNVNFTLYKGESIAMLGLNGAGKTTLFDILMGHIQPQSGEIIKHLNDQHWAYFPQLVNSPNNFNLTDTINFILAITQNTASVKDLYDQWPDNFKHFYNLNKHKPFGKCSGGEKRKILFQTLLFLPNKSLFILDEPTQAVDIANKFMFLDTLKHHKSTYNHSFITSTHITDELDDEQVFDRLFLLHKGKLVIYHNLSELLEDHSAKHYRELIHILTQ